MFPGAGIEWADRSRSGSVSATHQQIDAPELSRKLRAGDSGAVGRSRKEDRRPRPVPQKPDAAISTSASLHAARKRDVVSSASAVLPCASSARANPMSDQPFSRKRSRSSR